MEPISPISILEKCAVSSLLQQSHPVYPTEIWVVAPLKVGAEKGAEEELVEERDSWVWCSSCCQSLWCWLIRGSISGRSIGADLSELGIKIMEFLLSVSCRIVCKHWKILHADYFKEYVPTGRTFPPLWSQSVTWIKPPEASCTQEYQSLQREYINLCNLREACTP